MMLSTLLVLAAQLAPPPPTPAWNPVADYITAGQDEPGYRSWYLALPGRTGQVKAFNDYLATYQAAGILPTWQLLRTATAWEKCGGQPFEIPPTAEWPHIVQTLRYIHDYVVPAIGPVEAVSAYRNPVLNQCAGGAPESAHKHFSAIDLVPLRPTTREDLMKTLCTMHSRRGPDYQVGLGFYAFLRFHVDTTKYRRWNMDPAVAAHCPPIVHAEDAATTGQPLPQPAPVQSPSVVPPAPQPQTVPTEPPAIVPPARKPPPNPPERG
jgi:hypothetical protein